MSSPGRTVYEFYTAKDFPSIDGFNEETLPQIEESKTEKLKNLFGRKKTPLFIYVTGLCYTPE